MKKIVCGAGAALVLILGACGGDDDGAFRPSTEDGGSTDDGGGDDGLRIEYVEAIAASVTGQDSPFADLADSEAECLGAAYVDAIGVDELEAKVTPQEIRDQPESDHRDWGITITDEQGTDIYRALIDCSPAAEEAIVTGLASGFTEGFTGEMGDDAFEVDEACLADADAADLDGFMGAAIAQGDDFVPSGEQGQALLDWFGECADLRGAFLSVFTAEAGLPEGTVDCVDAAVDDRMVDEFWQLAFTSGGDDSTVESSPVIQELTGIVNGCVAETGG
ncbi:MAG TPA: hypothetical protein VIL36_05350 [Acidimicrobiales bacterium]